MYEAALSLPLSILFLNNFPYIQVGFNFVFFDELSSYFRLLNILYVLLKKFTASISLYLKKLCRGLKKSVPILVLV